MEAMCAALEDAGIAPEPVDGSVRFDMERPGELEIARNLGLPWRWRWRTRERASGSPSGEPAARLTSSRGRDKLAAVFDGTSKTHSGSSRQGESPRAEDAMARTCRLIDADRHAVEPPHLWETWLEPEFRDRAPRPVKDETQRRPASATRSARAT